jgi:hypothetical protein
MRRADTVIRATSSAVVFRVCLILPFDHDSFQGLTLITIFNHTSSFRLVILGHPSRPVDAWTDWFARSETNEERALFTQTSVAIVPRLFCLKMLA